MYFSKYLNNGETFFASILLSILTCAKISSEDQVKVVSDETSLNGKIYASPTVPPTESPLLVPLLPLRIGILIGRLTPSSDSATEEKREERREKREERRDAKR